MKPIIIPNTLKTLGAEIAAAATAACEAGAIIAERYWEKHQTQEKAVADFVTEVDKAANEKILGILNRAFPEYGTISEEAAEQVSAHPKRWVVDPLDGTAAYLFRIGEDVPSVMIALEENKEALLSVVLFPLTGVWFCAARGKGAFINDTRLKVAATSPKLSGAWVALNPYGNVGYESKQFAELWRKLRSPGGAGVITVEVGNSGVGCRVANPDHLLAAVVHDNAPEPIKQAYWDVVPIRLIVEEAGGVFWDAEGNRYNPDKPGPFVVAQSAELGREIVALFSN